MNYAVYFRPQGAISEFLLPLFQKKCSWQTIHMKMFSTNRFIFMQIKLIFKAWKALQIKGLDLKQMH